MLAILKNGGFHLCVIDGINEDDSLHIVKPEMGKNLNPFQVTYKNFYVLTDHSYKVSDGYIYRLDEPIYVNKEVNIYSIESDIDSILDYVRMMSLMTSKHYYVFPSQEYVVIVEIFDDESILITGRYEIGRYYFNRGPALEMAELPIEI